MRLTTFADWKELGAWFAGLERAARKVDARRFRRRPGRSRPGAPLTLEKLEALYDFVSKNFRYVSLSLGAGRYQPRAAADVLRDAYGDCKDKHTLLAALIDAAGLQASGVLINSRAKIDPDFPSPSQFDHVITRARAGGQDVWLDATPEVAPFRLLSVQPAEEAGAGHARGPGVAAGGNAGRPADGVAAWRPTVDGTLDEAGTLKANVQVKLRGDEELAARTLFRATPNATVEGRCWSRWRPTAA